MNIPLTPTEESFVHITMAAMATMSTDPDEPLPNEEELSARLDAIVANHLGIDNSDAITDEQGETAIRELSGSIAYKTRPDS